jgi:hypothetical protein
MSVVHGAPISADRTARLTLAHRMMVSQMSQALSPRAKRRHFFNAISRSMATSSIDSASSFFSLAFSSSSAFRRFASDTSSPQT